MLPTILILLFQVSAPCRVEWQSLHPGLDYRAITCLGDRDDIDVHVVRVDLERWNIGARLERDGSSASRVGDALDADLVVNANFFDSAFRPIGIVMNDGEELHPMKRVSWQSVFLITKSGKPKIVTTADFSPRDAEVAVQAGPRLVVAGHTNRVHQSYAAARAGVCIQKSGDLLFFATPPDRKFDMYETARLARRAESEGGLECRNAMLFDGGHSAQIFAEGRDKRVNTKADRVPVFIYAKKK